MPRHNRWLALFAGTRLVATAAGAALLMAHSVTAHHELLTVVAVAYGGCTTLAVLRWGGLQRSRVAWGLDAVAVLGLVLATEQWRSPFYLLGLTALIFPATGLPFRHAVTFGGSFTAVYFAIAATSGIDWGTLQQTARLESFATHLLVPMVIVLALASSASALRGFERERTRSERLAVEAERRRIAWELHDSAKQRVHAAHLMLTQHKRREASGEEPLLDHALSELRAATTDIETSLTELRAPLGERGLAGELVKRAAELERVSGVRVEVGGDLVELPPTVAAHCFRVIGEAMTNAVRHSGADRVEVRLTARAGTFTAEIFDDGAGFPSEVRPASNGIRSMRARAGMVGGRLEIVSANGGEPPAGAVDRTQGRGGTTVRLEVPLGDRGAASRRRTDTAPTGAAR